jgi:aminopeptidase YwaD
MKNRSFALLLLLSFALTAAAQKPQATRVDPVEANLRRHIEYLASDKLEGRRAGEKGATIAAGYIANQFAKLRLRPGGRSPNGKANYMQAFSYTPVRDPHAMPGTQAPVGVPAAASASGVTLPASPDTKLAYNVIGILPGTDRTLMNEAIVIGAHYDHLGRGGDGSLAANPGEIHHGADDNASGTAAIIELARQFAKEKTNKRTLIFIAFSGEEDGVFGSKYYVNNPAFPLDKTVAMINLDMVGRLNDNKLTIGGIGTASEWKELVSSLNDLGETRYITGSGASSIAWGDFNVGPNLSANEAKKLVDEKIAVPLPFPNGNGKWYAVKMKRPSFSLSLSEDGFGPSDHSSFYGKQIPVLFFFTGTHLDYHKPSDTADKINYEGLNKVRSFVREIVRAIDQNPQRPTYAVAKSANTGGRMGFSISLGTIPTYADSTDGMLLDGVRDGSPAAKAGLKAGDKVVMLAGKEIRNVYDYTAAMAEMKPDVEYDVVVLRGGERLELKIVPAKR